jgi:hypothetical protein
MEQQWCGKTQLTIHPQNVQHLDQYLMKPGQSDETCKQYTELCSKCRAAKCKSIRAAKND